MSAAVATAPYTTYDDRENTEAGEDDVLIRILVERFTARSVEVRVLRAENRRLRALLREAGVADR